MLGLPQSVRVPGGVWGSLVPSELRLGSCARSQSVSEASHQARVGGSGLRGGPPADRGTNRSPFLLTCPSPFAAGPARRW